MIEKNQRILTQSAHDKIKRLILLGESFSTIAKTVRTNKITILYSDVVNVFYNMISTPEKKPTLKINSTKQRYYENEKSIFEELNQEYKAEDLKGWEKNALNNKQLKNILS